MIQAPLKIDSDIAEVLCASDFDCFTVTDLRNAYLENSKIPGLSPVEARKIIYRQILRLLKHQLLEKIPSKENSREHRYRKTERFQSLSAEKKVPLTPKSVIREEAVTTSHSEGVSIDVKNHLLERLKGYRLDLLTSLGESEEYEALYEAFPELKSVLQKRYNQSRDHSSKVLGKVKALETLVSSAKVDSKEL